MHKYHRLLDVVISSEELHHHNGESHVPKFDTTFYRLEFLLLSYKSSTDCADPSHYVSTSKGSVCGGFLVFGGALSMSQFI